MYGNRSCQEEVFPLFQKSVTTVRKSTLRKTNVNLKINIGKLNVTLTVTCPSFEWFCIYGRGRRGRDHMEVGFQLHVQSMSVPSNVVSTNPTHCEVYSIQHYVIKFVSDLRQVGGFLWRHRFPPPIKLTATIYSGNITFTVQPFFYRKCDL